MTNTKNKTMDAEIGICYVITQCSLGMILVATSSRGICAILLGDNEQKLLQELTDMFPQSRITCGNTRIEHLAEKIAEFIEIPLRDIDLPLDIQGTKFQQKVWQTLREIPAGTTVSYSEIARLIGAPKSVRAVASACAANKLAVAIPCHRAIRSDGKISGYRWGIKRKHDLLDKEKTIIKSTQF